MMSDTLNALTADLVAGQGLDPERYEVLRSEAEAQGRVPLLEMLQALVSAATTIGDVDMLRREVLSAVASWVQAPGDEPADRAEQGAIGLRLARLLTQLGESEAAREAALQAFDALPDASLASALASVPDAAPMAAHLIEWTHDLSAEHEQRVDAAHRRATMAMGAGELDVAERWFQRVLELDPNDSESSEALETIVAAREAHAEMLESLRADVDAAESDAERAEALASLASALREDDPASPEAAALELEAAELYPNNAAAAQSALEALVESGELGRAAALGERWLETSKGEDRRQAARTVGRLLGRSEEHQELAESALRSVVAMDKSDGPAVDALVDILTAKTAWDEAIEVLQSARRATRQRDDERRWLAREGELLWRHKDDMLAAERVFRRVRAVAPNNVTAIEFFEEHFERQADWKRLHATLSQKFAIVDSDQRLEVAARMADLAEHKMDKLDKAIEPYKRVLTDDPGNVIAADRLVELYSRTGKWYALVDFLQSRVRRLPDDAEGREKKVSLLFQIIEIYQDPDKLPVEEMVIQNYKRIVKISPTNVRALDDLAQRYEDAHRWSELVGVLQKKIDVLQARVEEAEDADELLDLFHRVAALYVEKMSSESQAVPFLERILEIDPSNLDVVRTLRGVYKSKHNLERLYFTWQKELEFLDGAERVPVLRELASLATDKLYWHEVAIGHWEELLQHDDSNEKAASALLTLYVQEEMWDRYADLLASRLGHVRTRRRRVELLEKLGAIRFERLGDMDAARATYQELLEVSPGHRGAVRTLQRIYVSTGDWGALRALFAEQGDWAGYIAFLDDLRDEDGTPEMERRVQLEAARILEGRLNDSDGAILRLESVLADQSEDLEVIGLLLERYERAERTDDVLDMLERLSQLTESPTGRIEYLERGLRLLEGAERWALAFEWTRRVADLRLAEGAAVSELIEGLEAAALQAGLENDLATWYGETQAQVVDIDERRGLLRRQASLLHDRLRRSGDAIEVYEELSLLDADDAEVLDALERLTYAEKDWHAFERTLSRKLELHAREGDTAGLRSVGLKLARLLEDILDDPERAVDVYQRILSVDPADEDAFAGLESLYSTEERWDDLLALRRSRLEQTADPKGRAEQLTGIARVMLDQEDLAAALDALEEALAVQPEASAASELAWQQFRHEAHRDRVGRMIEPGLRAAEDLPRLITVLTVRLDSITEVDERRALLDELATLRAEGLGHHGAALALRLEHVALSPGDETGRQALERLAGPLTKWSEVAALYSAAIGFDGDTVPFGLGEKVRPIESADAEAALTRRLAEIYEAQLEQLDQSVECYERVMSYDPENVETLAALERLHARRSDWESLLAVYRARLDLTWEIEDKKSLFLDITQLLQDELGRPEDAIEYYRSYLVLDEESLDVIGELERLYADFERWDDLIGLLRRRLSLAVEPGDRVDVLMQIAAVHREHLDDPGQSFESYVGVLAIEPEHEGAITALESILMDRKHASWSALAPRVADTLQPWFAQHGAWAREIQVLEVRRELAASDDAQAAVSFAIGRLHEGPGRSTEDAFDAYSAAVADCPAHTEAVEALERTARALSRFDAWADVLELSVRTEEPSSAIPLLLTLGTISRAPLDDSDRAIDAYERVLALEPLHATALEALDELYDLSDQIDKRAEILQKCAQIVGDDAARRALRFEIGVLYAALERSDEAIENFSFVADHGDPAHEPLSADAVDRLLALYEASDRTSDVVATLVRKAEYATDDDRYALLRRAAELSEDVLDDASGAIELYERVREGIPEDSAAFENLERLLTDASRFEDLEDLLLQTRARVDGEEATVVDLKLGRLYDDHLRRRSDAIDRYEAVLDREPGHIDARAALENDTDDELGLRSARILERAFETTGDIDDLIGVLERQLSSYADQIDIPATHRRLSTLQEVHAGDTEAAFSHRSEAARLQWTADGEDRAEIVRLARITGRWDDLELTDREALSGALDAEQRLVILGEMARVALEEREDSEVAEGILREIQEESPGHSDSLESLRELYEGEARFEQMVEILRLQADHASGEDRTGLLYGIAAVLRDQLEDTDGATQVYEEIIVEDSSEEGAWDALEAIYTANADHESVATLLLRRAEESTDEDSVFRLLERRLTVLKTDLDDRSRALDAGTELMKRRTDSEVAIQLLEECRADRYEYDRVVRELIPVYEQRGNTDALQEMYEEYAQESDVDGRIWAYESLRALYADVRKDVGAAFDMTAELVRCEPTSHPRWKALEKAASQLGRYSDAVALYGELIDEGRAGLRLALRAAGLCESQLGEPRRAAEFFERVLDLEPGHAEAEAALIRIYQAAESWDELSRLRERQVDAAEDDSSRIALLDELVRIQLEHRNDPDRAADALSRRFDLEPSHRPTFEQLLGLHRAAERLDDVEDLYRRWLGGADGNDAADARLDLAEFLLDSRADAQGAVDTAESVLLEEPQQSRAVALLERVFESNEAVSVQVARILDAQYDESTGFDAREAVLEVLVSDAIDREDDDDALALHRRLGALYRNVANDPEASFGAYASAARLAPTDPELRDALEAVASDGELHAPLDACLSDLLGLVDDEQDMLVLLRRLAQLESETLQQPGRAAERYEAILDIEPSDTSALAALEAHYAGSTKPEDLARILRARLDASDDDEQRVQLLNRLAELALSADDADTAIAHYRDMLAIDASLVEPKLKLIELYRGREDWEELVSVLRQRLGEVSDSDDRIELLDQIAEVHERKIRSVDDAIATFREIQELSPANVYAITSLERLLPEVEDWEGLLSVYEAKKRMFADPRSRAQVDFQIGQLLFDRLDRAEDALEAFRLVLVTDATHESTVGYLERMLELPELRMAACFALEPIYEETQNNAALARLVEVQLEDADDPDERADMLKRLGGLRFDHLSDAEGAMEALREALALMPSDAETREQLSAVADASGQHDALADALEGALGAANDNDTIVELNRWLATLYEERLQDPDRAIERWRDVLAYDPAQVAALVALSRLLEQMERWDELVDVHRQELASAPAERARALRSKLGHVLLNRLQEPADALDVFRTMVFDDPDDSDATLALTQIGQQYPELRDEVLRVLTPLHQTAERWSDLVDLLLGGLAPGAPASEVVRVNLQVAEVYGLHIKDQDQAYAHYRTAFLAAPNRLDILERIEPLAEFTQRYDDLESLYAQAATSADAPDVQRELLTRAGRLALERLQDRGRAEQRFKEVLAHDPEDYDALTALERIYEHDGRVGDLIDVCEVKVTLPIDLGERISLHRKVAKAAQYRQETDKAVRHWASLVELDRTDLEALEALDTMYQVQERHADRAEIMERRAAATDDPDAAVELRIGLARLRAGVLDDTNGAIEALEEALLVDTANSEALSLLDSLYTDLEDWSGLARTLERRLELAESGTGRIGLLTRLAELEATRLERWAAATVRFEEVHAARPDDPIVLVRLSELYAMTRQWEPLVETLQTRAKLAKDVGDYGTLMIEAAETIERRLSDGLRAARIAGEVLELDPTHRDALRLRARLLTKSGEPSDAIAAWDALLPKLESVDDRVEALMTLGQLQLDLGNSARALSAFRDALALDPEHVDATRQLKKVLYKRESWEALVPVLEREFARTSDRAHRADLAWEIARINRDNLGRKREAVGWLRKGYDNRREHPEIVGALVEHYVDAGRPQEAEPLLAWFVSYLEAKRQYGDLAVQAHRLGELYEAASRPDKAIDAYKRAYQADSQRVPTMLALGRLQLESGKPDKALQTLQGLLLVQQDIAEQEQKEQMFLLLARASMSTGEQGKARRHLKRLLQLSPNHTEALALQKRL